MNPRRLKRLFLRFRERRDYSALTELFDATAAPLLALASHLVREADQAEDVLQSTFLAAIERADAFDAGRELYPWLAGILVHKAQAHNRRADRVLEPERLGEHGAEPDPAAAAGSREVSLALRRAILQLPETYREVLLPYLDAGEPPRTIAARLALAPGTVRVRIHRGLDLLRKALPSGFALGGAAFLLPTRGLDFVRAVVLEHAKATGPMVVVAPGGGAAIAAATSAAGIGWKLAAIGASVLGVGGLGWLVGDALRAPAAEGASGLAVVREEALESPVERPEPPAVTPPPPEDDGERTPQPATEARDEARAPHPIARRHERPSRPRPEPERVEPTEPVGRRLGWRTRFWVEDEPPGMVLVREGRTWIGSEASDIKALVEASPEAAAALRALDAETPRYQEAVQDFHLMPTEVTNEQYLAFVTDTGHRPPIEWGSKAIDEGRREFLESAGGRRAAAGRRAPEREEFDAGAWWTEHWRESTWEVPEDAALAPVTWVDYAAAEAYCAWAGMRLPSEVEFQRAGRGDSKRAWPWGDDWHPRRYANTNLVRGRTGPMLVGSFPEGASEDGILDLSGNVWEWTSSPYLPYPGFEPKSYRLDGTRVRPVPAWDPHQRVVVGGSWQNGEIAARLSARRPTERNQLTNALGFRAAATPKPLVDVAAAAVPTAHGAGGVEGRTYEPRASVGVDRWEVRERSRDDPEGYAVVTGYDHVAFVPVDELEDSQDVTFRKSSIQGPVVLGLLTTDQPLRSPRLEPGVYAVLFRAAGKATREVGDPFDAVEGSLRALGYDEGEDEELDTRRDSLLFVSVEDRSLTGVVPAEVGRFEKGDPGGSVTFDAAGPTGPGLAFDVGIASRIRKRVLRVQFRLELDLGSPGDWRWPR